MSTSTVTSMFDDFVTDLWGYISAVLPVVVPVLIGLAFIYGLYRLIVSKAKVK